MVQIYNESGNVDWESKEVKEFKKYLKTNRKEQKHKLLNFISSNGINTINDPNCNSDLCKKYKESDN